MSSDVKWSQVFLGSQGNPSCTRQGKKTGNLSALILMNLNELHLESRRSHAHKCTAYTTCCLHVKAGSTLKEWEMTGMIGMSLLTIRFSFLTFQHWSRDVPSLACEAMMKTSRTSPYSLKHSSSWALGSLCFRRTHTVSETENLWTRGLSLLKKHKMYPAFYVTLPKTCIIVT